DDGPPASPLYRRFGPPRAVSSLEGVLPLAWCWSYSPRLGLNVAFGRGEGCVAGDLLKGMKAHAALPKECQAGAPQRVDGDPRLVDLRAAKHLPEGVIDRPFGHGVAPAVEEEVSCGRRFGPVAQIRAERFTAGGRER